MKIAYVGPNKGAGLEMPNSKIVFQGKNSKFPLKPHTNGHFEADF